MAHDTDNPGGGSPAQDASFSWETFNAMLNGLKTDDPAEAEAQSADTDAEAEAKDDDDADLVGPTLPRVDPFELAYHKLRARRRRVLARRAGQEPDPADELELADEPEFADKPEPADEPDFELEAQLQQEPAGEPEEADGYDEESEREMAEHLANRFAPAGSPALANVSVYAPRHRRRVTPDARTSNPRSPDNRAGSINPLDYALERELGEDQPELLSDDEPWWQGEPQAPERGRVVLFGSIAVAALLVSGVSAYALFGGWGERASGAGGPDSSVTASLETGTVLGLHNDTPRAEPEPDVIAPLMSTPDSADLAGAQRLVPRSVLTTTYKPELIEPAEAPSTPGDAPEDQATLTVVQGPDTDNPVFVRGKSVDRLEKTEPDAVVVPAARVEPVVDTTPPPAKTFAEVEPPRPAAKETGTLAYAPTPADVASDADAAIEEVAPARREIVGAAPPDADAAPVELIGQSAPKRDAGSQAEWAGKLRIDLMLARGRELLNSGDLMAARLLFAKVADAGDPRGAIAMAETYDPDIFRKMNVVGLAPDAEMSVHWRKRAEELRAGDR